MLDLTNFDIDDFLANYWQKKPLLIRQALPGFESIISPEELAGLACEEGVHSRLVIEKDAETPWQLSYGPFTEDTFTSLPLTHYSLLVSECEKWIPELQELVDCFNFIPKWRIDDLMISYAPEHGSVGPHVDEYDVFLIQAKGKRDWSIENSISENTRLIPDTELAILQQFNPDQQWVLEPGDILYLPPKLAHHGVAMGGGCMTYSVGFRAPAVSDIMDSFLLEASDNRLTDTRYTDIPLSSNRNPAEIKTADVQHFKSMIDHLLDQSTQLWPDIVGKLLSDSTLSDDVESISCDTIKQAASKLWQKHPDSKLFYFRTADKLRFYHNGQVFVLKFSEINLDFCKTLCNQQLISVADFYDVLSKSAVDLLLVLINSKALIPVLDDE